jgi:hypothetical protein
VKTSANVALALVPFLSASLAAYAQTERPTVQHHDPVHHHHHYVAHNPARALPPIAQQPGEPVENGAPQPNLIFNPYAHPGDGDNDGLSRDPDDCMKGCIGGNPG